MHCHNVVHEDHAMMVRWDIRLSQRRPPRSHLALATGRATNVIATEFFDGRVPS